MDLFNKKKIEILNNKLKEAEAEQKNLNQTITSNNNWIENLQKENEKLRNWILNFLDVNGCETTLHIPYERAVVPIEINECFRYDPGVDLEPLKCERIFVPALEIRKITRK